MVRLSKIALLFAMSFFCFLVVLGNITDYQVNFPAVQSALSMKDVFPNSTSTYRAILNPTVQYVFFGGIVLLELMSALLCFIGGVQLLRSIKASASVFNHAKNWAIAGLTVGFVTWQVLFMTIGGEWFGMWMSTMLNGAITTAFHIFITFLGVLIYVVMKDE